VKHVSLVHANHRAADYSCLTFDAGRWLPYFLPTSDADITPHPRRPLVAIGGVGGWKRWDAATGLEENHYEDMVWAASCVVAVRRRGMVGEWTNVYNSVISAYQRFGKSIS